MDTSIDEKEEEIHEVDLSFNIEQIEEKYRRRICFRDRVKINPEHEFEENEILLEKERKS